MHLCDAVKERSQDKTALRREMERSVPGVREGSEDNWRVWEEEGGPEKRKEPE